MSRVNSQGRPAPASLWDVLTDGSRARLSLYSGLALYGVAQLMILYAIESQLAYSASSMSTRQALMFGNAVLVIHIVFRALLRTGSRRIGAAVTTRCERMMENLLTLDLESFESIDPAELQLRLSADRGLAGENGALAVEVRAAVVVSVLVTGYAMTFSLLWGALMFGGVAAFELSQRVIRNRIREQIAEGETQRIALLERIRQMVRGFKEMRLHKPRRAAIGRAFRGSAEDTHQRQRGLLSTVYKDDATGRSAFYLILGLVAFLMPVFGGHDEHTSARLMLCLFFLGGTIGWLTLFGFPRLAQSEAAWLRLQAFDAHINSMMVVSSEAIEETVFERLAMHDVCYQYRNNGFSVGPFELTVEPGELIFITGANGSGKSTFLKVLTGLYRPTSGRISFNGRSLEAAETATYQTLFAVILTDFTIFERLYGREDIPGERVTRLLEQMGLAHAVAYVDGRFSTTRLSTGQRKRLALVVALLQDRPIYIFDEWAADQDPEFRVAFYKQILPELQARGKTVLAVTHDDEWFHMADRHIHFVNGRIET